MSFIPQEKFRRSLLGIVILITVVTTNLQSMVHASLSEFDVLVFSRTHPSGHRHDSIPKAVEAIRVMGREGNFNVEATEDPAAFNDANLARYEVVVFAMTIGEIFDKQQEAAFERYIRNGGGFVGIHSASSTQTSWPFFTGLVGATYEAHSPGNEQTYVRVLDPNHPSTEGLKRKWIRGDEWYSFKANPRGKVHVLMTVDEVWPGPYPQDHPVSWCQLYAGGRSWFTAMGHFGAAYSEKPFLQHLLGGIRWAAGNRPGDCTASVETSFDRVVLEGSGLSQPSAMDVAADGRIFVAQRSGEVKVWSPAGGMSEALKVEVSTAFDQGLTGLVLDPAFESSGYIYLAYSVPAGNGVRISRFKMASAMIDSSTERVVLTLPVSSPCCHHGAVLAFDSSGNLLVGTGDDTYPYASNGYATVDERAGKESGDAQRTSSDASDLRGKILRIKVLSDGSASVPTGNLFPADGSLGNPLVFGMGLRDPASVVADPMGPAVFASDRGPDATVDDPDRGPRGFDEINRLVSPLNLGWPYCISDSRAYVDFDFETDRSKLGAKFNCAAPANDSPNNKGPRSLPPAASAWASYATDSTRLGEYGIGSRGAGAGAFYRFDPSLMSSIKLPSYYDQTLFLFDTARGWIKEAKVDEDGSLLEVVPFMGSTTFQAPVDLDIGPDGAMYVLEWGQPVRFGEVADYSRYESGGRISRIDFTGPNANRTPVAVAESSGPLAGASPLQVSFSAVGSFDPDLGDELSYTWDLDGDGVFESTGREVSRSYPAGNTTASLRVTDAQGKSSSTTVRVASGNSLPTITLTEPAQGRVHFPGESVPFSLSVRDNEDGSTPLGIDCASVIVMADLIHDDHSHPIKAYQGCSGIVETSILGHSLDENISTSVRAVYSDAGSGAIQSAVGEAKVMLQPNRKQAEFFGSTGCARPSWPGECGVKVYVGGDPEGGGKAVGSTHHGDYMSYGSFNLAGIRSVAFRVGVANQGGIIEVRLGSPTGPRVAEARVLPTGGWYNYVTVVAPVVDTGGTHELFLTFVRPLPLRTCDLPLVCQDYLDNQVPIALFNWMEFSR